MSRSLGGRLFTTRPPIEIVPEVISSRPAIIRSAVDLPQPDGPTRTMNSPSLISRFSPSTAFTPPAYTLSTFSRPIFAIAQTSSEYVSKEFREEHYVLSRGGQRILSDPCLVCAFVGMPGRRGRGCRTAGAGTTMETFPKQDVRTRPARMTRGTRRCGRWDRGRRPSADDYQGRRGRRRSRGRHRLPGPVRTGVGQRADPRARPRRGTGARLPAERPRPQPEAAADREHRPGAPRHHRPVLRRARRWRARVRAHTRRARDPGRRARRP